MSHAHALPRPWNVVAADSPNASVAPWTGAVGVEAPRDPTCGSIPSVVCWTTRPNGADSAALIVAAVNAYQPAESSNESLIPEPRSKGRAALDIAARWIEVCARGLLSEDDFQAEAREVLGRIRTLVPDAGEP